MGAAGGPGLSGPEPVRGLIQNRFEDGLIVTSADQLINWSRKNSIWFMTFGLACCAIEMMATGASRYDTERFGIMPRGTPRQTDLMIVAGTVTLKMATRVKRLYAQMPEPKYVLSMGACATSGGPFKEGYNVVSGIDKFLPVDVYVPGCPPKPEALLHGFLKLFEKIEGQSIRDVAWYRKTAIEAIPIPVLGPDLIDPRRALEIHEMSQPQVKPAAEPAQA